MLGSAQLEALLGLGSCIDPGLATRDSAWRWLGSGSAHLDSWLRLDLGLRIRAWNQLNAWLGSARSFARARLVYRPGTRDSGFGLALAWLGLSSAYPDRSSADLG